MTKFTVLVKVPNVEPEYEEAGFYFAYVEAKDTEEAIKKGTREAWMQRGGRERGPLKNWRAAYILLGHPKLQFIAPWIG